MAAADGVEDGRARAKRHLAAIVVLATACARESPLVSVPRDAPRSVVGRNVRVFDARGAVVLDGLRDVAVPGA